MMSRSLCWTYCSPWLIALGFRIGSSLIWYCSINCWRTHQNHFLSYLLQRWCDFSVRSCIWISLVQSSCGSVFLYTWYLPNSSLSLSAMMFWNQVCSLSLMERLDAASDWCPDILCRSSLGTSSRRECTLGCAACIWMAQEPLRQLADLLPSTCLHDLFSQVSYRYFQRGADWCRWVQECRKACHYELHLRFVI